MYLFHSLEIMIVWPLKSTSRHQTELSKDELLQAMTEYPEITGMFVRGSNVVINANTNPEKGAGNGTHVQIIVKHFTKKERNK